VAYYIDAFKMTVGLLWLPRLLFWTIVLSTTIARAQPSPDAILIPPDQIVLAFVDIATCYDGLVQADANRDDRVERDEYLTFVQYSGPPGFLADIDSMADAPLTLQENFLFLSCVCLQNGGDSQCCSGENAHIPIDSINIADPSPFLFLSLVCTSTIRSIDLVLEEAIRIPSISPTIFPEPSPMPSNIPSISPTISPEPSLMPSDSAIPTATPELTELTQSPSFSPSAIPTTISPRPTTSPTSSLYSVPSAVPSTQPSSMHTEERIGVVARTIYTVLIVSGLTENVPESSYVPDLIASMNVVAVEVASEVDFGNSDGSRHRVSLPTSIDGVVDAGGFTDTPEPVDGDFELGGMFSRGFELFRPANCSKMYFSPKYSSFSIYAACPSDLANSAIDRCEEVTASIGLFLDGEAPQVARQLYQAALDRFILQGRLQDALTKINPNSPVRILTGKASDINYGANGSRSTEPGHLSAVSTAGIVLGGLAVVVGFMVAISMVRKREGKPDKELHTVPSSPSGVEFGLNYGAKEGLDSAEKERTDEEAGAVESGKAVLGATKPDYGQNYGGKPESSSIEGWSNAGDSQTRSEGRQGPEVRNRLSSASSAGQSGWSSSCTSSIASGGESMDELEPSTFGTRMAELGNASKELDETSLPSLESSWRTCDSSLKVMLDEQEAAELHRLIEGGDWEGVIQLRQSKAMANP
jgi:hypothetical protein